MAPVGQTWPQVPQLLVSFERLAQSVVQLDWPVGHVHTPAVQDAPVGHTWPQLPQLLVSFEVLTQLNPLHTTKLVLQVMPHVPEEQVAEPFEGGLGQAFPHVPQLDASVCLLTQEPLQLVKFGLQTMLHAPVVQEGVPLALGQACPHAPQLLRSLVRLVSQPSVCLFPLQSA